LGAFRLETACPEQIELAPHLAFGSRQVGLQRADIVPMPLPGNSIAAEDKIHSERSPCTERPETGAGARGNGAAQTLDFERIRSNVRELEGALRRVIANSRFTAYCGSRARLSAACSWRYSVGVMP
jgi:hypothetical protein